MEYNLKNLAPIILFTYNRPWHTRQTIEALQKNSFAEQSDLIIYSDAPKDKSAIDLVNQVRDYIKDIKGFKSIRIVARSENWGLAKSIISGVTEVIEEYGTVIVLEDDIVTSPAFLNFMNQALELYANDERVMHISGYSYPIEKTGLPETFFLKPTTCWSWATWGKSWQYFRKDSEAVIELFDKSMIKDFNLNGAYDYFQQVEYNHIGILNTWAIFWYASIYLQKGLSLHPRDSYAHNIGHDNMGENCGVSNDFDVELTNNLSKVVKIEIVESSISRMAYEKYFNSIKPRLHKRVVRKIKSLLRDKR